MDQQNQTEIPESNPHTYGQLTFDKDKNTVSSAGGAGKVRCAHLFLFLGLSQQEYWSGLSFPPPGDLPKLGIKFILVVAGSCIGRWFIYH